MIRTCESPNCNKTFSAKESDVNRGWAKFCSKKCAAESRKLKPSKPKENSTVDMTSLKEVALMFMHSMLLDSSLGHLGYNELSKRSFEAARCFIAESELQEKRVDANTN